MKFKLFIEKLEGHVNNLFDGIFRCWRLFSRKEDLFQEITNGLCNFASNRQINSFCLVKLTDPKCPIFVDIANNINK